MTSRRQFLLAGAFALVLGGGVAMAQQDHVAALIARLRDEGYTRIRAKRTWLGRVQIRARKDDIRREIVMNPVTGEILRDYWEEYEDDDAFEFFDRDDEFDGDEVEHDDDEDDDDD